MKKDMYVGIGCFFQLLGVAIVLLVLKYFYNL
jgi:hypothetical protein